MGIRKAALRASSSTTNKSSSSSAARKGMKPGTPSTVAKTSATVEVAVPVSFQEGQKVVYPGHGVGQVQAIETKEISGVQISFYMIRVLENDITVMVPVNKVRNVGVRPIIGEKEVKTVYEMLKDRKIVVEQTTWNRRYREYMEKIKTGSIFEITEVLRDLCVLRAEKVLSFGERKMLELAKGLLVKELAIAEETDEPTVEAQIEELFAA